MSDIVIKVENLSKQYRLGSVGLGTLSHDINRWWYRIRGRENPYLKIGDENNRDTQSKSEYQWALKDIDFEVRRGEVLGIIGRNGAGKSTLLKILSRITAPTTGKASLKGRVASLLEVGIGFHPELTGRENIFLNGAILGMHKKEIQRKFSEIVEFSGVQRYIETPVKRYSSGMYVRLAFAVAAHLEPDILIVDEVLAVGDSDFQKKAIGKMKEVSHNEGRTVLFVSHNISAVHNLCDKGLILKNGRIFDKGDIDKVVETYINSAERGGSKSLRRWGNRKAEFLDYRLCDEYGNERNEFFMGANIYFHFKIRYNESVRNADIGINIKNNYEDLITHVTNFDDNFYIMGERGDVLEYRIQLQELFLSPNMYHVDIAILEGNDHYDMIEEALSLSFVQGEQVKRSNFPSHVKVFTKSKWELL